MKEFTINPWEVKGNLNYDKIIEKFQLKRFEEIPELFKNDLLFKRKFITAHRDFDKIIEANKNKESIALVSGAMPSGEVHLGHSIVFRHMSSLSKISNGIFFVIADIESYLTRKKEKKDILDSAKKNIMYLLAFINKKVDIYFQSFRSKKANNSNKYYSLAIKSSRHITDNEIRAIYGSNSLERSNSALMQFADILHPCLKEFGAYKNIIVPIGFDQDPHIRLARDLAKRQKLIKPASTYHIFLSGLKGGKMSSSDPNSYISLNDDEKTVALKIKKYALSGGQATLKEHREKGGNPDIDVSYQYYRYVERSDKKIKDIYHSYKNGDLLSGELKEIAIESINKFLKDINKKAKLKEKKAEKIIETIS